MYTDTADYRVPAAGDIRPWYVMTHPAPSLIDRLLRMENAERVGTGRPALLYVIPYLYMVRATAREVPDVGGDRPRERRQAAQDAADNNGLRDSLHGFVFIRATADEIAELTGRDWNRQGRLHLYHYRTRSGSPIRVSHEEMQPLLCFLVGQRQRFSFTPFSEDMPSGGKVYVRRGVFRHRAASVLEVRHLAEGTILTLGIPLFGGEVMMRLHDCPVSDVEVRGELAHLFEPQFARAFESDLLGILRRRVLRRGTAGTFREDMGRLNTYGLLHCLRFGDAASHRHLQALLLLCATLRGDRQARESLVPVIRGQVADAEAPSTDAEAFHVAVLFVATAQVAYRDAAREYCRTHAPLSESLAAIMPLVKRMRVRPR